MMDVKAELRYLLVTRTLEAMAQAGFLSDAELAVAKGLALERYWPATVVGIVLDILVKAW